jgi:hypothetical protein
MKISWPTNNEFNVILAIIICLEATMYLMLPRHNELGLILSISTLVGSFSYLSGWIIGKNKNNNGILDFLKLLLPTSGTLIATIWLLSSGYLNLRAENLKREIQISKNKDSILQVDILNFSNERQKLLNENESLSNLNKNLKLNIDNFPDLEKNYQNLKNRNIKLIKENKSLNEINDLLLQKHVLDISKTNSTNQIYFTIKDQKGKILGINEIGLEWTNTRTNTIFQLKYNKEVNKYFLKLPVEFLKKKEAINRIEFDFSFIHSNFSDDEINDFRRINGGFQIGTFGAEYELIVFL